MTVETLLAEIRSCLASRVDPVYREGASRFFQHEVQLHGVRQKDLVPIERLVYREVKLWPLGQRNRLCDELWKAGMLEEGAIVCHVYRRFSPQCGTCEFKLFERWMDRYVHNWAHCDGVSTWLIAASIANEPSLLANLPLWTQSSNVWKRRSAAVSLLQEAKRGTNTELILDIASRLAGDGSDMVQKGVGWVLKEAYPRRPREVVTFLRTTEFPRLVLRYAAEKMSASHRAAVLTR
jgi:3-methyladenine DNA glycosylase AlkD